MFFSENMIKYLSKYHNDEKEFQIKDFEFLEKLRVNDARKYSSDDERWFTGVYSMQDLSLIRLILESLDISDRLKDHIEKYMKEHDNGANNRKIAKSIWTYNFPKFLPWNILSMDIKEIQNIFSIISAPKMEIINGKVYISLENFKNNFCTEERLKILNEEFFDLGFNLVKNPEPSHITLINSNVLPEMKGFSEKNLLTNLKAEDFEVMDVRHTLSFDFSLFSLCVVVALKSSRIEKWLQEMSDKYSVKLKPCLHTTVAVHLR